MLLNILGWHVLKSERSICSAGRLFSTWVSLFVVGVDSLVSNVTGGWMDKTKDEINSFSRRLIAQWEPKVFFITDSGQTFNIP